MRRQVIVVTGDNKATAEAICRAVGVLDPLPRSSSAAAALSEAAAGGPAMLGHSYTGAAVSCMCGASGSDWSVSLRCGTARSATQVAVSWLSWLIIPSGPGLRWCCAAGVEFDELQAPDQSAALANMAVFARVEPSHKQRLVEQLKAQVGMSE